MDFKRYITAIILIKSYHLQLLIDNHWLADFSTNFTSIFFFFLSGFSFTNIHDSQDSRRGGGYLFNSSLPLLPASQTPRHWPGDYCTELTCAHSQQPDLNREPLISERKSLTTKLRALVLVQSNTCLQIVNSTNRSNSLKDKYKKKIQKEL